MWTEEISIVHLKKCIWINLIQMPAEKTIYPALPKDVIGVLEESKSTVLAYFLVKI